MKTQKNPWVNEGTYRLNEQQIRVDHSRFHMKGIPESLPLSSQVIHVNQSTRKVYAKNEALKRDEGESGKKSVNPHLGRSGKG